MINVPVSTAVETCSWQRRSLGASTAPPLNAKTSAGIEAQALVSGAVCVSVYVCVCLCVRERECAQEEPDKH